MTPPSGNQYRNQSNQTDPSARNQSKRLPNQKKTAKTRLQPEANRKPKRKLHSKMKKKDP